MKWQTRLICSFVAATVPVEKAGDVNELLENAKKIGEPDDERESQQQGPKEPEIGSFERFMSVFGNPARWAGH